MLNTDNIKLAQIYVSGIKSNIYSGSHLAIDSST